MRSAIANGQSGLSVRSAFNTMFSELYRKPGVPGSLPAVMTSPPTITIGVANAVSAITGAANGTLTYGPTDTHITQAGGIFAVVTSGFYAPPRSGGRLRFLHIGRRFEFRLKGGTSAPFSVFANGQLAAASWVSGIDSVTGNQLVLVDFGVNTETFVLRRADVSAGGTGYVAGEIITLTGGSGTQATIRVTSVSGGVITGCRVETGGSYSAKPSSPAGQGSTTGVGTGATFTFVFGSVHTTIDERRIEIVLGKDASWGGLNLDSGDKITPWPEEDKPRRLWICDSFGDGSYPDHAAGIFPILAGKLLGNGNDWTYGVAGMGWTTSSHGLSGSTLTNIYATNPDRVVVVLGTNDSTGAALIAAVTSKLDTLMTNLPNAVFTVIAGYAISQAISDDIAAGVALAADQTRVQFKSIMDGANNLFPASTLVRASDNVHPHQGGHNYLAAYSAMMVDAAETVLVAAH